MTNGPPEFVDANQVSVPVNQRAAAVARVDRCIGLHVDHGGIEIGLAGNGRDDAHGDGIAQAFGTAEGKNNFALADIAIAGKGQSLEFDVVHFQEGDIDVAGHTDDARAHDIAAGGKGFADGVLVGAEGKHDADELRAIDDVSVGDDVAAGIDDETRADRALAADDHGSAAAVGLFKRAVAGDQNLHDAGGDLLD